MRKFDLLEKLEVYQIDLLIYMSNVGGTTTKSELLHYLNVGNYFLSKLIEGLISAAQKSNNGFSIKVDKQTVTFQTKSDYSLHTLYNELILSAPKYRILEELLLFGTVDAQRLSEKIGISHSTYFRKINELNHLLKEFDLSIQNGSLIGSELQIRFFYVSLFARTDPKRQLNIPNIDPRVYETVDRIQLILGSPFSSFAKKKLIVYLCLLKRRNAQKTIKNFAKQHSYFSNPTDSDGQKRFIAVLKNSQLFKKINTILESFVIYYSFKMVPDETILLLLFMFGEEIIPMTSHCLKEIELVENLSNFCIGTLTSEFLTFMEKCYPAIPLDDSKKKLLSYSLNSIGYHHLIFKGHIDYYWKPTHSDSEKNTHSNTLHAFINHLKQTYPTLLTEDIHDRVLITRYAQTINFYEESVKAKLSVGIFIESDLLHKTIYTDRWIKYVELTTFAYAEPLAHDKVYDLVISNVDLSQVKNKGKYFFFLTNYNEKMDANDLNQLLYTIYSSYIKRPIHHFPQTNETASTLSLDEF